MVCSDASGIAFVTGGDFCCISEWDLLKAVYDRAVMGGLRELLDLSVDALPQSCHVVNGRRGVKAVVKKLSFNSPAVFIYEGDEVKAVVTPASILPIFSEHFTLSDLGTRIPEAINAVVAVNTTLRGALRRMVINGFSSLAVRCRGRFKGVITAKAILRELVMGDSLEHVMRGNDDYYFESTVTVLELERNGCLPISSLTREEALRKFSEAGYLAITRRGALYGFYEERGLIGYLKALCGE